MGSTKMAAEAKVVKGIGKEDTNITFEDQQMINTFARKNAKLTEKKDEIEEKKKELQNLEDAGDEMMMLEDESAPIPYQIGEIFINLSPEETQEFLERSKTQIEEDIKGCQAQSAEITSLLADLKVKLYAKFGSNINLEADE